MRIMKLFVAAAIAAGTLQVAAAPAEARLTGPVPAARHDTMRHDARDDHDRSRHQGMHSDRGRHHGWATRRVCRTIWRHGHRQRVCRTVRYRR